MNKITKEIYLNCKEQGLLNYLFEAYFEINFHNITQKGGKLR